MRVLKTNLHNMLFKNQNEKTLKKVKIIKLLLLFDLLSNNESRKGLIHFNLYIQNFNRCLNMRYEIMR